MLDICDQDQIVLPEWEDIASRARLPVDVDEYLGRQGPTLVKPDSRRKYHRLYLRVRAVLRYGGQLHAIYMADVSRTGVGFYAPVQLLPCASIDVWTPDGRHLKLKSKYCLRLEAKCYRCGAVYEAVE